MTFQRRLNKLVPVDSGELSKEVPLIYRVATLPGLGEIILKPTLKALIRAGMKKGVYNPELISGLSGKNAGIEQVKHCLQLVGREHYS